MQDTKQQTGKYRYPYLENISIQWLHFAADSLNQMDSDEYKRKKIDLVEGYLLVCEDGEIGQCAYGIMKFSRVTFKSIAPCTL